MLTVGVETGLLALILWVIRFVYGRRSVSLWRNLGAVLVVNLLVHPIFWVVHTRLMAVDGRQLLLLELGVVGIEAILYWRIWQFAPGHAFLMSLILNGASLGAGIVMWRFLLG